MPAYDRAELVEDLKNRLAQRAVFLPWDTPDTDLTIVVAGCPNACVDIQVFSHKPIFFLKHLSDAGLFINLIKSGQIDELAEQLSGKKNRFGSAGHKGGGDCGLPKINQEQKTMRI